MKIPAEAILGDSLPAPSGEEGQLAVRFPYPRPISMEGGRFSFGRQTPTAADSIPVAGKPPPA